MSSLMCCFTSCSDDAIAIIMDTTRHGLLFHGRAGVTCAYHSFECERNGGVKVRLGRRERKRLGL